MPETVKSSGGGADIPFSLRKKQPFTVLSNSILFYFLPSHIPLCLKRDVCSTEPGRKGQDKKTILEL